MKRLISLIAVCAALLTITAIFAYAKQGDPIPGIPVGLEGDPDPRMVVEAVTNEGGNVNFNNLKPGRYIVVLQDTSRLRVPCRISVTFGREKLPISEPILPGKPGTQGFALDRSGHKVTVVLDRPGGQITIHISSAEGTAGTPMREAQPSPGMAPRP